MRVSSASAVSPRGGVVTRSIPLGGIDQTQALLSWISLAIPFSLIIGAHLVYARVLMKYAKE